MKVLWNFWAWKTTASLMIMLDNIRKEQLKKYWENIEAKTREEYKLKKKYKNLYNKKFYS